METFRAWTALCKTHVERAPCNDTCCRLRTALSQLQIHAPFCLTPIYHYLPNICSRKTQKLQTVATYHVHNSVLSKAKQCSGTAATSLCQLGLLSGGNAPGGTADVCAPAQMGASLPALAFAGVPE